MPEDVRIVVRDREARAWLVEMGDATRDFRPVWASVRPYMAEITNQTFDALGPGGRTFRGVTWPWFADQYTRKTDNVTVPAEGGVPRIRWGISTRTASGSRKKIGVAQQIIGFEIGAQDRSTRAFVPTRALGGRFVPGREMVQTPTGAVMAIVREAYTGLDRYKGGARKGWLKEPNVRAKLRPSGTRVSRDSLLLQDTGHLRAGATEHARETMSRLVIYVPGSIGYAAGQQEKRPFLFFTDVDADYIAGEATRYIMGQAARDAGGKRAAGPVETPSGSALEMAHEAGLG